jgi:hypothetical protein
MVSHIQWEKKRKRDPIGFSFRVYDFSLKTPNPI